MGTTNNNRKKIPFRKIVFKTLGMAFAAGPAYIIFNNLLAVVNGVSQGVITYMTQLFFESISNAVMTNTNGEKVFLFAFALFFTIIVQQLINGVNNFMGMSYFKKVIGYFNEKINRKASKIDPLAFENTELLDDINKASEGANNSLGLLFTITTIFSYYIPYFLFMFFYLYSLDPLLAVSIVLVFIPVALSQFIRNIVFANLEDKIAPLRREYQYYKECVGDKETRMLGGYSYFKNLLQNSVRLLNNETWNAEKKAGIIELATRGLTLLGYMGILLLFVNSLLKGTISVGAFAAVYGSIAVMFGTMNEIISRHIANMTKDLSTIKNFIRFLEMDERKGVDKEKTSNEILLQNVSFKYPHNEKLTLDNINLKVKNGETVAIVGENGSGKTTLVKVILGLYLPQSGNVFNGGLNTKEVSLKSVSKKVTAVFQNFQRYKMTLKQNIQISQFEKDNEEDKGNLENLLKSVGLNFNSDIFPDGLDTVLSREFNGVELSGGQWQRLAIARGLYRDHNIILLDEPTAAIDPIEELNVYQNFARISKDKTALIITHRLASAKLANRILVMDKGKIIENGSHEDLMNKKGLYHTMYMSQSKWYQNV